MSDCQFFKELEANFGQGEPIATLIVGLKS